MRCPFAEWRGNVLNHGGTREHPIIGLTVHHMDGWWQGAESRFNTPGSNASAAFGVKLNGDVIQWLDTELVDYHACMAQWEGWIGCENESDPDAPDAPPTPAQIASMGRLVAWLGIPATPAVSRTSGGVGYHRQFPGPCNQAWGQTACPGQGFIDAIPAICAAASGTTTPTTTPEKGKKKPMDMITRFGLGPDDVYLTDWQTKRKISPKEQAMWKYFGGQVRSIDQEIFDSIPDVKK